MRIARCGRPTGRSRLAPGPPRARASVIRVSYPLSENQDNRKQRALKVYPSGLARESHSLGAGTRRFTQVPTKTGDSAPSFVRKNVRIPPSQQIELCPNRQEGEGGGGELGAPFARQHGIELVAQRMQVQHIGSSIGKLSLRKIGSPPVGRLLLFRQFDPQELASEVLQSVPIGVGSGQFRGDLRTVEREGHSSEGFVKDRNIESGVMEELDDTRVGEKPLEVRGMFLAGGDLHDFGRSVAARQLDEAKPVAIENEPERFSVDSDAVAKTHAVRQVAFMQGNHDQRSRPAGITGRSASQVCGRDLSRLLA